MKKAALVTGGILAVLLLAAMAVPAMIDWNRFKPEMVARAEAQLGRKVDFGNLTLRLLPAVTATAEKVSVANLPGGEAPAFATAQAVRVRLKLLPLLAGRVAVDSLVVEKPDIQLERLPDGRGNWEFAPAAKPADETAVSPSPAGKPGARRELALNGLAIRDGAIAFRSPGKPATVVDGISADLDMASLDGIGGSPLRASLAIPSVDARLQVSGVVGETGRTLNGNLTISAPSLTATSPLSLNAEELALPDLTVTMGDAKASGSVVAALNASPVQVDAVLKAGAIDLDRLLGKAPSPSGGGSGRGRMDPPAQTPGNLPHPNPLPLGEGEKVGGFSLPGNVAVHLELSAEAVTWRGDTVRQVALDAMLEDGRLSLSRASATLPGATAVSLTGVLAAERGRPDFDGRLQATAADLRQLLQWLKLDVASVPEGRLKRAALTGKVGMAGDELRLTAGDLALDDQRLKAAGTLRLGGPWSATLSSDRLEAAPYLPAGSRKTVARLGPLAVTATAQGGPSVAPSVKARLVAGGVELSGEGRLGAAIDMMLSARADSYAQAVRLFVEGYRP